MTLQLPYGASLSRRRVLGLAAGTACHMAWPAFSTGAYAQSARQAPVLVELFTSQGCSSCPPADGLIGELAQDPNLLVVAYHVDYWDYLGWRDTMAQPEFSQRQYDYADARGDGAVYTPQLVINGSSHVAGNNRHDVLQALKQVQRPVPVVDVSLSLDKDQVRVAIPESAGVKDATLWLLAVQPSVEQRIERGENAGQTITYHNVVRAIVPAAMVNGSAYQGQWMRGQVMAAGCTQCVAILQQAKAGPVLGVARA